MADETDKDARDNALRYSQYDLDAATKPLHSEIERLREALRKARAYLPRHARTCMRDPELGCSCGLEDLHEQIAALLNEGEKK